MFEAYHDRITDIFAASPPHFRYQDLGSRSIRNSLLAFYLLEFMPGEDIQRVLAADTGPECVPKLSLVNETYLLTGNSPLIQKVYGMGMELHSGRFFDNPMRLGTCYPNSRLGKTTMVSGLRIYRHTSLFGLPSFDDDGSRDITLAGPAFEGVAEDANPAHGAACYLLMLHPIEEYVELLSHIDYVGDLRALLAFQEFHSRTETQELKEGNLEALLSRRARAASLIAALNWNKDVLHRMQKT